MTNQDDPKSKYLLERKILEARERLDTDEGEDPFEESDAQKPFTVTGVKSLDSFLGGVGRYVGLLLIAVTGGMLWAIIAWLFGIPRIPFVWLVAFILGGLLFMGITRVVGRTALHPLLYWLFPYGSWFAGSKDD